MKSLEELSDLERAALLFNLFPDEVPVAVEFIYNMAIVVLEDSGQARSTWNNDALAFDKWLRIAKVIRNRIARTTIRRFTNGYFLGELLFAGQLAVFSKRSLVMFVTVRKHPNEKFATMVTLLFGLQPTI